MEDKISEFLKRMGMRDKQAAPNQWDNIIQPKSSYLLTGDVGTGKSALAYFIMETYGRKYELTPTVVGLPRSKRSLLPDSFNFLDDVSQIASREHAIVFIDEADIQLPLDSNKNKQEVVNFLSLPRQRKQIFILAYHFPRLVKGTYLPFFSAFMFKHPPYLIEFATKKGSEEVMEMMRKAKERFGELPADTEPAPPGEYPKIIKKNTYVVAPRVRWQGMLENPLASFWTQELSEIWSGTEVETPAKPARQPGLFTDIEEYLKGSMDEETRPEAFGIEAEYAEGALVAFNVADPDGAVIRERARLITEVCRRYPQFTPEQLKDTKIIYGDYHARIELETELNNG